MKAVIFEEVGPSSVLKIADIKKPQAKDAQVLVRVFATTIDNVDIIIRKGLYKTKLQKPAITGRDLVGRVEEVGPAVTAFSKGDLVWTNSAGFDGRMGASAEYVLVESDRLYHLDQSLDPFKVLAALHAGSTAQMITRNTMKLNKDSVLLVEGAGGNVGRKLVQAGKILKAKVLTTSAEKDFALLKKLGADLCFSYDKEGMAKLFKKSKEINISHIIDTSGRISLASNLKMLANFGQLVMITPPSDTTFDASDFYTKGKSIQGFVLSKASAKELKENAKYLNDYFKKGLFLEDDIEILSFEKIPDLHKKIEEEGLHGKKYIFKFKETI
jgi:NADPH:quinone reductase-like Zn-dependent oxidoreductase